MKNELDITSYEPKLWAAVTYGYTKNSEPRLECFATEQEALDHLRETAQDCLDAGENPPLLDEWFVAKISHEIRLTQRPFEHTGVTTYEVQASDPDRQTA